MQSFVVEITLICCVHDVVQHIVINLILLCKFCRVLTTLENMENMEISGNLLILENSGKTQGI